MPQHTRQPSGQRIDDHQRRQLPAAQHVVADRQLLVDADLDQPLVDAFIAPREQHQRGLCG